ncbi:MAG: DivIVA domain-containing protein [Christensenellales bacterium]|jgi:cell division initiation protein
MPITVNMIEEKEFKIKVRGYDPMEVDEFLDEICDEMIIMQDTIASLREKAAKQDSANFAPPVPMRPAPQAAPPLAPTPPAAYPSDVEAAKKLLEETQKACDEVMADAKKRAEEIIQEAKDRVPDPEITDLEAQRDKLREEIENLKEELESFRSRFMNMLDDQKDLLDTDL